MKGSRRGFVRAVALLAVVATAGSCARSDPSHRGTTDASELAARIGSGSAPIVLDVRTPEEFAGGHIAGAINVPHDALGERLPTLDLPLDAEIVVHCESGRRAMAAESILSEAGYTNVRDLDGHMKAWRDAGLPVE
jgi:rhodanese-related sulfurtransferase